MTFPPGFKARVGSIICTWQRHMCYTLPRFISGVTPANLLAVSMTAEGSLPHTCKQALVGLETGTYHAADECSTDCAMPVRLYKSS